MTKENDLDDFEEFPSLGKGTDVIVCSYVYILTGFIGSLYLMLDRFFLNPIAVEPKFFNGLIITFSTSCLMLLAFTYWMLQGRKIYSSAAQED
ncbi:MAG: hypothetical protein PVG65_04990 [Candidatus Thorarchaeota archaeon]|jgi:hypothetical protein